MNHTNLACYSTGNIELDLLIYRHNLMHNRIMYGIPSIGITILRSEKGHVGDLISKLIIYHHSIDHEYQNPRNQFHLNESALLDMLSQRYPQVPLSPHEIVFIQCTLADEFQEDTNYLRSTAKNLISHFQVNRSQKSP